ncbi:hypothetical protein VPHD529_0040 [Vibrio phage D529]
MSNRFDHITSKRSLTSLPQEVSQRETSNKPDKRRMGRDVFDTLMGLLSEDTETPTTPYGVLVANSTKRNLRKQIEGIFQP